MDRKKGDIIRPVDGYELGQSMVWVSLTDDIPDINIDPETLSTLLPPVLSKYDVFNMTITLVNAKAYWVWLPVLETGVPVESVPWVDVLPAIEESRVFRPYPGSPMFRIALSVSPRLPKDETSSSSPQQQHRRGRLTIYASHAICDGRSLENLYRVVRSAIPGQPGTDDLPNQGLCAFGKADNFTLPQDAYNSAPPSWNFKFGRMVPDFDADRYVLVHSNYANKPIRSYCRKHHVSVQGAMMAMMSRAYRKYNKVPYDTPIYSDYMIDSRHHPAATEEYRAKKFFCGAASGFPVVIGQGEDIGADIAHCTERMRADYATNDSIIQVVRVARCIDPETLVYTPLMGSSLPDYCEMPITITTNIGKYENCINPRIGSHMECMPMSYHIILYGCSTDERMYFLTLRPNNLDPAFVKIIEDEINAVINYMSSN